MKMQSIALMFIGILLLTGCTLSDTPSGSGLVTDAKGIVGTWQKPSGSYSQFKEDAHIALRPRLKG